MFNACVFLQQDVEPLGSVVYDLGSPLMLFCTRGILFLPFCCFHRSLGRLAVKQEYFTIILRLQGLAIKPNLFLILLLDQHLVLVQHDDPLGVIIALGQLIISHVWVMAFLLWECRHIMLHL